MGEPKVVNLDLRFDLSPGSLTAAVGGSREPIEVHFEKFLDVVKRYNSSGKKLSQEFRIASAEAILFCFKRAKPHGSSNIKKDDCIYISDQEQRTINAFWSNVNEPLRTFEDTFREIFTVDGEIISKLARGFCEDLKNGEFVTTDEALKDPLFWSASQKITFFKTIYEMKRGKLREKVITKSNQNLIIKKKPNARREKEKQRNWKMDRVSIHWIEKLKIDADEVEEMREKGFTVSRETIFHLAGKNRHGKEEFGDELYHFLRFFRNIHAHFWECEKVTRCFRKDPTDGYWDFFNRRFPELLLQIMKDYRDIVIFKDPVEPKFLPDLK